MALTLDQKLADLDKKIADIRGQIERTNDRATRAKLERQITVLDVHERKAINRHHAEQEARQTAQQQAVADFYQGKAAEQEQTDRAMLKRRWIAAGGSAETFEIEAPKLLRQLRIDRTLGRDVGSDIPSPRTTI